ncbi:hypothetical protein GCM10023347_01880 [Streptomyces chumphonensis]
MACPRLLRRHPAGPHHSPPDTEPEAASDADAADTAQSPAVVLDRPPLPDPAPAVETQRPADSPATESPVAESAPSVSVPAPLLAHARKVADTHRAQTGQPIDTDTLRARLNVPSPMASAIAAQLP